MLIIFFEKSEISEYSCHLFKTALLRESHYERTCCMYSTEKYKYTYLQIFFQRQLSISFRQNIEYLCLFRHTSSRIKVSYFSRRSDRHSPLVRFDSRPDRALNSHCVSTHSKPGSNFGSEKPFVYSSKYKNTIEVDEYIPISPCMQIFSTYVLYIHTAL